MSSLASSLNLNQSWALDMQALSQSASLKDSTAWGTMSLFSGANYGFQQTPPVLQITYPQGSYQSPSNPNGAPSGGAQFYFRPFGNDIAFTRALLEYDLFLPADFPFNQGGKMPGLYATSDKPGSSCDGGAQSDGTTCWSVRLMWRSGGAGEAYAYVPTSANSQACSSQSTYCSSAYGSSLSRGAFTFPTNQWATIGLYIQVNTPSNNDGVLKVYLNQKQVISFNNIQFRSNVDSNALLIRDVMFSTFFGGNTADWAAPASTFSQFRNIRFSVGQGFVPSSSTRMIPSFLIVFVSTLVFLVLI